MKRIILMLLASIGLASICGCDGSANQVKNGTLRQYPDVTVGAAFDSSFDNAKWETLTDKGRKIVRFTGRIKQETHDAAVKKTSFDASTFCQEYKAEEFKKRFAPYEEKLAAFYKTHGQEYEDAQTAMCPIKEKYDKLEQEEQPVVNDYLVESTPAKKKVLDEIKRRKELLEKEYSVLQKKIDLHRDKVQQMINANNEAAQRIQKEMLEDFKKNSYWPAGQDVEFSFIVYPDGKKFEIASFSNESWADLKLSIESVLNVIFAK